MAKTKSIKISKKRKLEKEKIKSFRLFVSQLSSLKNGLRYYQRRIDKCNLFFGINSNYLSVETKNEIRQIRDKIESLKSEITLFELDIRNHINPSDSEILQMNERKEKILKLNCTFVGTLEKYEWIMRDNENYKRFKRFEAEKRSKRKQETIENELLQKESQTELSKFY